MGQKCIQIPILNVSESNSKLKSCVLFVRQQKDSEKPMTEEAEEQPKQQLPADMYYSYEELHSKPSVTPDSEISENLLYLWYLTHYYNYSHC